MNPNTRNSNCPVIFKTVEVKNKQKTKQTNKNEGRLKNYLHKKRPRRPDCGEYLNLRLLFFFFFLLPLHIHVNWENLNKTGGLYQCQYLYCSVILQNATIKKLGNRYIGPYIGPRYNFSYNCI